MWEYPNRRVGSWETIENGYPDGVGAIQWDGGVDNIIHGKWSRILPALDMKGMGAHGNDDPAFTVCVVADGFGPKYTHIPVKLIEDEEWTKFLVEVIRGFPAARTTGAVPVWRKISTSLRFRLRSGARKV